MVRKGVVFDAVSTSAAWCRLSRPGQRPRSAARLSFNHQCELKSLGTRSETCQLLDDRRRFAELCFRASPSLLHIEDQDIPDGGGTIRRVRADTRVIIHKRSENANATQPSVGRRGARHTWIKIADPTPATGACQLYATGMIRSYWWSCRQSLS